MGFGVVGNFGDVAVGIVIIVIVLDSGGRIAGIQPKDFTGSQGAGKHRGIVNDAGSLVIGVRNGIPQAKTVLGEGIAVAGAGYRNADFRTVQIHAHSRAVIGKAEVMKNIGGQGGGQVVGQVVLDNPAFYPSEVKIIGPGGI